MSAITRAKALIEALKDSTITNALGLKIVEGYLRGCNVDVTSMTSEQKAQAFLTKIKLAMKNVYRHSAAIDAQVANQTVVDAALAAADADFD
jgi:hypothetical protein